MLCQLRPASDLFLGWPNKNRIATSYVEIPGGDHYDVYGAVLWLCDDSAVAVLWLCCGYVL